MAQKKKTCFVIGPIGKAGSETRRRADFLLNGIIRPALDNEADLSLWRADEDSRPGMITDKVINDINDSDLVIADLSELNPNAFYELGIRHSAGKPTIHVAAQETALPFDNLGHRTIFFDMSDWENIENSRRHLLEQFKQALAPDYEASNPVTQALNAKAFKASPSSTEKAMGEIMRRLENLETKNGPFLRDRLNKSNFYDLLRSKLYLAYEKMLIEDNYKFYTDFEMIYKSILSEISESEAAELSKINDMESLKQIIIDNEIPF